MGGDGSSTTKQWRPGDEGEMRECDEGWEGKEGEGWEGKERGGWEERRCQVCVCVCGRGYVGAIIH